MPLSQLIYSSEICLDGFPAGRPVTSELGRLLKKARRNNERASVTGILLFSAGHFLQVLEGPSQVLNRVFQRIARDPRHKHIEQLAFLEVSSRMFEGWQMGLLNIDEHRKLDRRMFDCFKRDVQFATSDEAARDSVTSLLQIFKHSLHEADSPNVVDRAK